MLEAPARSFYEIIDFPFQGLRVPGPGHADEHPRQRPGRGAKPARCLELQAGSRHERAAFSVHRALTGRCASWGLRVRRVVDQAEASLSPGANRAHALGPLSSGRLSCTEKRRKERKLTN